MNKQIKLFAVLFIVVVLGVSLFATNPVSAQTNEQIIQQLQAQIEQLKAQITALQRQLGGVIPGEPEPVPTTVPVSSECPEFSQRLYPGVSDASAGGEVTILQKMLANDPSVYPEKLITGYYGPLTEKAVQRWQTKQGVVSSGSPVTTGYGVVGPQTRAQIIIACPTPAPRPIPPSINAGYLQIEPSAASIAVGEKKDFQAFYQPPMPKCDTPGIACPQVMPARFPVEAEWTSSNSGIAAVSYKEGPALQSIPIIRTYDRKTAVVSGISNGTADIKAAYKSPSGTVLTATAKVTVGSVSSAPSITVLSPNGGETWTKGTTQTIKWQDNTPIPPPPPCQVGVPCYAPLPVPRAYDIKLVTYYPSCTGTICPSYPYRVPYTIASSVYGSQYSWSVSKILDTYGTGGVAPDGSYTVQVCQIGSSTCDSSDSYFKIISGGTSTNNPPVINGIPAIPVNVRVGQSVSSSWGATDADGDNLSWGVSWGDGIGVAGACQSSNPQNKQGWTFNESHAWSSPGTYTVTATANDCRGGSNERSFVISVN